MRAGSSGIVLLNAVTIASNNPRAPGLLLSRNPSVFSRDYLPPPDAAPKPRRAFATLSSWTVTSLPA